MGKYKSKSLKYYYGIPHAHSLFSTGKGTPNDAYEYAKNKGLDFLAITDHNSFLSKDITLNHKTISRWSASNYMLDKFSKKNDNFLPLLGFECKSYPYGDFNIINSNTYFTGILKDLRLLVLWMINNPNSIITINHPHKNILLLEYNALLNKLITSLEVGNGYFSNKYVRHDKYYYLLLDKGWKLGAINSQDNHKINFGDFDNVTGVLTTELNNKNIIDAFRNRLTFSTESKTLKLCFTINECLMGQILHPSTKKLKFNIFAEDIINKIIDIEIVTSKNTIIKKINAINLNSIKYIYEHELNIKERWYLIRIYQEGHRLAISSPIFLE